MDELINEVDVVVGYGSSEEVDEGDVVGLGDGRELLSNILWA